MKKQKNLKSTIAGFLSMSLISGGVFAEAAEMTKPKGAVGKGMIKKDSQNQINFGGQIYSIYLLLEIKMPNQILMELILIMPLLSVGLI
jgi:hypothetical protein